MRSAVCSEPATHPSVEIPNWYSVDTDTEKFAIAFRIFTSYAACGVTPLQAAELAVAASERGDPEARNRLIEAHLPLVRRIARRFAGRGERFEDLVQVGSIGLIGAVDRCDPERATRVTAYVAACIEGEIRRHLRDRCAVVRIPRRIQQDSTRATAARMHLPLVEELCGPELAAEESDEQSLARAMVRSAADSLDGRERHVVALRFFGDLSQAEIGGVVGVSQVHVSRLLQGAIEKMRARLEPDQDEPEPLAASF
jgi:RNA polymerase sigma-B factor